LEKIWNQAAVDSFDILSQNLFNGLSKTVRSLIQGRRCLGRYKKCTAIKQTSYALERESTC